MFEFSICDVLFFDVVLDLGFYTIGATIDDGFRLLVDGKLCQQLDRTSPPTDVFCTFNVASNRNVLFELDYFNGHGGAVLQLFFARNPDAIEVNSFKELNFTILSAVTCWLFSESYCFFFKKKLNKYRLLVQAT